MIKSLGLSGYDPRVHGGCYNPNRVNKRNAVREIIRLLGTHQILVLTGTSKQDYRANRKIGKTTEVCSQLILELERTGRNVLYLDLYELIDPEYNIFYARICPDFKQKIDFSVMEFDVYIFDEVQSIFPHKTMGEDIYSVMHFWRKVESLVRGRKKIIYVTLLHPQNRLREQILYNPTIATFLSAPVVELLSNFKNR